MRFLDPKHPKTENNNVPMYRAAWRNGRGLLKSSTWTDCEQCAAAKAFKHNGVVYLGYCAGFGIAGDLRSH